MEGSSHLLEKTTKGRKKRLIDLKSFSRQLIKLKSNSYFSNQPTTWGKVMHALKLFSKAALLFKLPYLSYLRSKMDFRKVYVLIGFLEFTSIHMIAAIQLDSIILTANFSRKRYRKTFPSNLRFETSTTSRHSFKTHGKQSQDVSAAFQKIYVVFIIRLRKKRFKEWKIENKANKKFKLIQFQLLFFY